MSRTARGTAFSDDDGVDISSFTIPNITALAGSTLVVGLVLRSAHEPGGFEITSIMWGSSSLTVLLLSEQSGIGLALYAIVGTNLPAGTHDIVVSFGLVKPQMAEAFVTELSGLVSPYTDQSGVNSDASGQPSIVLDGPTIQGNEYVIAMAAHYGPDGSAYGTWNAPFSTGQSTDAGNGVYAISLVEGYQDVSAIGTFPGAMSGSAGTFWASAELSFIENVAPPVTVHLGGYTSYDIEQTVAQVDSRVSPEVAQRIALGDRRFMGR